ncbi:MAG: hypothetical protein R3320_10455, partial [Nitriliruptorales bacterium]|nr:hypothetical protein [Nitriliruptorales bacterium]
MLVTDAELTVRARHGDLDAFGALVQRWLPSVYDIVARLVPEQEEADGLTVDVFANALAQLRGGGQPLPFGLILMEAAYEQAGRRLASRARRPVTDELGSSLEHRVDRRVWHAFLTLDFPARFALHLHVRHGFTAEQLAGLVDVPRGRAEAFLAGVVDEFMNPTAPAVADPLVAYAALGNVEVPAGLSAMLWRDLQRRWAEMD